MNYLLLVLRDTYKMSNPLKTNPIKNELRRIKRLY